MSVSYGGTATRAQQIHLGVAQEQSASFGTTRPLVRFQSPRLQVPSLSSRAEHLADNRGMKVQVLQGGPMVVESEAVEERGREPRRSGCKSHRSPQSESSRRHFARICGPMARAIRRACLAITG